MDQREEQPSRLGRLTAHLTRREPAARPGDAPAGSSLGDGFTRSFELAVTPAVVGLGGFGLDRWLGTTPVLTVVLTVLALVGVVASLYFGYRREMEGHEARLRGSRSGRPPTPAAADVELTA